MTLASFRFRDGSTMPRYGLGTWRMGESAATRANELAALRLGLDLGTTLIDTAEMYGSGGAEEIVGEAIRGRRDEVFVVTKFYPHHAARGPLERACEGSLARLGIDTIDLYLLHWRGSVPFDETVETLERLAADGKIRRWGVSNLDVDDMEELASVSGGGEVAANQVLYSLTNRGIEFDLLPWCAKRAIPVMAYSPLDQGAIASHSALRKVASKLAVDPAQVALAWVLRDPALVAIPKATRLEHVRANRAAADLALDAAALAALDAAFPPPRRKTPLAMA
jgi:diketogulonate reductase-like aldo/keto reductase